MKRLMTLASALIAAVALTAQAYAAVETNQRFSFDAATFTCSGKTVDVHVEVHLLSRAGVDAQGVGHVGSTITTFFRGTTADGDRYVGPSHQTTQLRGVAGDWSIHTETFNQNLILLGENGTADDLRGRAVFHFTINANGEVVSEKFEFTSECS